jgi:hypothetical protein
MPGESGWASGSRPNLLFSCTLKNAGVHITVLNSKEVNAFALPGGFVFVERGLLEAAEDESRLAGVFSHQMSHVVARHGHRLMTKATIASLIFQAAQVAAAQMELLLAQAFSQMLAKKSGGFAWFPTMSNAFHDVTEGIMQSVAAQYRIVYDTKIKGSGKFRKIKVEAFQVVNDKRTTFKVLVREGWR